MIFFTVQISIGQVSAANTTQTSVISQTNQSSSSTLAKTSTSVKSSAKTVSTSWPMISSSQIRSGARYTKSYIIVNHRLPTYIKLGTTTVTMPQFLELLTTEVIKMNKGLGTASPAINVKYPNTNVETIKSTNFSSTTYLKYALSIKYYLDKNRQVPSSFITPSGRIQYSTLVYTYCKIVDFQTINKRLPNSVSVPPWRNIIGQRPIYITSDNINNIKVDNARINSIVKGLTALGLYAKNWGLGPNSHYQVLQQANIPKNALIIDIYGGACAGTIYEMGESWYLNAKDTKKVFTIFWPPSQVITGLDFLPRAHDDNFTPKYGEAGGFPNVVDVNQNGKIETGLPGREDGLAHPDQYMHKYGYNYLYSGDISTIVAAIYKQDF